MLLLLIRLINMRQYRELISLTQEQRKELKQWAQSRTLPAGDVFRARLILALADGWSYTQIKQRLHTSAPTISRWKQRFEQEGIAGLEPQHKGSQPRVADAQVPARIARKTQQKPPDGSTHWSCRKMAEAMGVSKSTVHRVWAQARLKRIGWNATWPLRIRRCRQERIRQGALEIVHQGFGAVGDRNTGGTPLPYSH